MLSADKWNPPLKLDIGFKVPVCEQSHCKGQGPRAGKNYASMVAEKDSRNNEPLILDKRAALHKEPLHGLHHKAHIHHFALLLRQCRNLTEGKQLHAHITRTGYGCNRFLGNLLIHMYSNCGSIEDAYAVFLGIKRPNIFTNNIMIRAFSHHGYLTSARKLFYKMSERDLISWTLMISAFAQHGYGEEALHLFAQMELQPDRVVFMCILDVCANLADLEQGKAIHAQIVDAGVDSDMAVGTTLINMYGQCGSLDDAKQVFDKMHQQDVVCWTAFITAYAHNGFGKEALKLFHRMIQQGIKPDKAIFISVLDACASIAALSQGKQFHAAIVDAGLDSDMVVGTSLITMYGKCGSAEHAKRVFNSLHQRDVVTWNALIVAYAENGHGKEALAFFKQMNMSSIEADMATFISVLSACSHTGMEDDGWHHLISMSRDHGIKPTLAHYGCMIDLVGRAGKLDEAEDLIKNMPFQPDMVAWMAFLGACRIHGDVNRAAFAARRVSSIDSRNTSPYILL